MVSHLDERIALMEKKLGLNKVGGAESAAQTEDLVRKVDIDLMQGMRTLVLESKEEEEKVEKKKTNKKKKNRRKKSRKSKKGKKKNKKRD